MKAELPRHIYLIGVESLERLSMTDRARLQTSRAIVLSRRHRTMLAPLLDELPAIQFIPITPVQAAMEQISTLLTEGDVAVLATGDPLFFGIGRTLLHIFGPERIIISPALSSLQMACARFKIPWDDTRCVSLHGRQTARLSSFLHGQQQIFFFTDQHNSPDQIARTILAECGPEINAHYCVHTAENIGLDGEKTGVGTLGEIAKQNFGPLTVMMLTRTAIPDKAATISLGLTENEIAHDRGLITKNEVRAASLHALRLPAHGVFWDVGAGSGSIGLEASRLCPGLQVFAVEHNEQQLANIHKNRHHFQTWNLRICPGTAPEALSDLPDPDRVFIGGSGGKLCAIIEDAARRLPADGRIVINAVLPKTADEAPGYLSSQGLQVTISEIAVTRRCYPPSLQNTDEQHEQAMNPITIIVGQKTNQNKEIER
jgi:precorrin-6Y C5,15-methyltransferase (decarboxylating)